MVGILGELTIQKYISPYDENILLLEQILVTFRKSRLTKLRGGQNTHTRTHTVRTNVYRVIVFVVVVLVLVAELDFYVALRLERHPILVGDGMLRERGLLVVVVLLVAGDGAHFGMVAPPVPEEAALALEGTRTPVAVERPVGGVRAAVLAQCELAGELLAAYAAHEYAFAALKHDVVAHVGDHHRRVFGPRVKVAPARRRR